jgi:hypothetical protein
MFVFFFDESSLAPSMLKHFALKYSNRIIGGGESSSALGLVNIRVLYDD